MSPIHEVSGSGGQAERTALAWSRTLIALAALLGFLAVHAALGGGAAPTVVILGLAAAVTLACTTIASRRRWATATKGLAGDRPAADPWPLVLLAAGTGTVAVVAMILVFVDWR